MENKELYIKNKIEKALGKSDKFTIDDAINYFIKQYGAKEIDPQYVLNYWTFYYCTDEEKARWKSKMPLISDISKGVLETEFYHKNEYARVLVLNEDCLRRSIKNYDEIIRKQDERQFKRRNGDQSIGIAEWRENSVIVLTTANGKKILNFEYEGVGINIDLELCYICEHTIGGSEWHNYYGYDSYRFEEEAEM